MIGITMGDPAGVGPEIILKAIETMDADARAMTKVFGNLATLQAVAKAVNSPVDPAKDINLIDVPVDGAPLPLGKVDARAGDGAYHFITAAVAAAQKGEIGCIVTAPIHKEALNLAGHHYDGHTGLLAHLTGEKAWMLLASDALKVIHTSTHVPLSEAIKRTSPERVYETIRMGHLHLQRIGIKAPRIAMAGINPHCGENGLFGDEDDRLIAPGVAKARAEGIDVSGPISADTVFHRAYSGAFDLVIANYHDQGHIPIKLVAFDTAVNVSVGLPIDRTSVDHGTAFDIAGKGIANHENLLEAIAYARRLVAGGKS